MCQRRPARFDSAPRFILSVKGDKGEMYCASISYGKDSLAMLHVITNILHKPLDRIITAEVWATDTIQADLPPMVEFKEKADRIIKEMFGIDVEHFYATDAEGNKWTYEKQFYKVRTGGIHKGKIYGFPCLSYLGAWCNSELKRRAINQSKKTTKDCINYVGIASDEPKRIEPKKNRSDIQMPLVEAGWTEAMCRQWCEENNLLSPLYATFSRGGVGSAKIKGWIRCELSGKNTLIYGQC